MVRPGGVVFWYYRNVEKQKVTHYGPHIYSTAGLSCFGKVKHPSFDYHYMLHSIYMQLYHAA